MVEIRRDFAVLSHHPDGTSVHVGAVAAGWRRKISLNMSFSVMLTTRTM